MVVVRREVITAIPRIIATRVVILVLLLLLLTSRAVQQVLDTTHLLHRTHTLMSIRAIPLLNHMEHQGTHMVNLQINHNLLMAHHQISTKLLQANSLLMEGVNNHHTLPLSAEFSINQVMDLDILHHNPNNIPALQATNRAVVGTDLLQTLNLAIMLRCLVDCMAVEPREDLDLMYHREVNHILDNSIKASSLLDHHHVKLEDTTEQDIRDSREDGNLMN